MYSDTLSNLSAPKEYSDGRTSTGKQATPTEVTTTTEAVERSSPKWHHLGFALTQLEEEASNTVVEGIILLYNSWACILFDPDETLLHPEIHPSRFRVYYECIFKFFVIIILLSEKISKPGICTRYKGKSGICQNRI